VFIVTTSGTLAGTEKPKAVAWGFSKIIQMDTATKIIDIIALVIQFIGALLMYLNSPINRITGTQFGGNYDNTKPNLKNKILKIGFLVLSIGILFSIISLLLKDFFVPIST